MQMTGKRLLPLDAEMSHRDSHQNEPHGGGTERDFDVSQGSLSEDDIRSSRGALLSRLHDDNREASSLGSSVDREPEEKLTGGHARRSASPVSRIRRRAMLPMVAVSVSFVLTIVAMIGLSQVVVTESITTAETAGDGSASNGLTRQKTNGELPRVDIDYEGLSEMFDDGGEASATEAEKWADALQYIQWGSRPEDCWPIQIKTPAEVECGSCAVIMAAILFTGDYTITPNSALEKTNARYGIDIHNDGHSYFLKYMEEEWGIHRKYIGHMTAEEAKKLLQEGHIIEIGVGCDGCEGLPYCKAEGVTPRCCHGHTIIFYKYKDGFFYAKDSAPSDGSGMCKYPEGPLTVTHHGAMNGLDIHNGETVSLDNYADAFFRVGWCSDLWCDNPAKGITKRPPGVKLPDKDKKDE